MRRTTLITAALLALLLAPALQAQYGGYRNPDRYGNRYPDYGHMDRVSYLAHQLDETARNIYRQAARNNRRPDQYEAQMLDDLRQLAGNAAHFHDEVEGNRQNPRHTANDFARLEESFNQLGLTMQSVRPRPYVDRGMERIYNLMTELSRYYGGNGYDRWGRYGHDRYDGDRYDRGRNPYDRDYNRDNGYRPPQ
ncbi:MAG: hypothetical protein JF614_25335 [Acidobacteria bacterium]|nr:hypothetical protein [Acidobacteriota bacterium]